ncbi:hypothetical protein J41TS4_09240 [Paenibacillus apis]|uniref:Uncharacterized protein n=1 Tax=Paenibacillus apis TaxID=1792174 RepID=A0A919XXK7_9BACL|nr:hypothetical protein J41TS4_09240 [Paenibacillus apis]
MDGAYSSITGEMQGPFHPDTASFANISGTFKRQSKADDRKRSAPASIAL